MDVNKMKDAVYKDILSLISSRPKIKTKTTNSGIALFYDEKITSFYFIVAYKNLGLKQTYIKNKLRDVEKGRMDDPDRYILERRIVERLNKAGEKRKNFKGIILEECSENNLDACYDYWSHRLLSSYFSIAIPYPVTLMRSLEAKYLYDELTKENKERNAMLLINIYKECSEYLTRIVFNRFGEKKYLKENVEFFKKYVNEKLPFLEDSDFADLTLVLKKRNAFKKYYNVLNSIEL